MKLFVIIILAAIATGCGSCDTAKESGKEERLPSPPPGTAYISGEISEISNEANSIVAMIKVSNFRGGAGAPSVKSGIKIPVHFPISEKISEKLAKYKRNNTSFNMIIKAERVFGSENEFNWRFGGFQKNKEKK